MMPQLSGVMLLDEMRKFGFINPCIFLTAYPNKDAAAQVLNLVVFDFLEKPFISSVLEKLLWALEESS